jgi:hypothetical protein
MRVQKEGKEKGGEEGDRYIGEEERRRVKKHT